MTGLIFLRFLFIDFIILLLFRKFFQSVCILFIEISYFIRNFLVLCKFDTHDHLSLLSSYKKSPRDASKPQGFLYANIFLFYDSYFQYTFDIFHFLNDIFTWSCFQIEQCVCIIAFTLVCHVGNIDSCITKNSCKFADHADHV